MSIKQVLCVVCRDSFCMHSVINGEIITVRLEQTYKLFIYISIRDFIFLRVHRISDEFFSLVVIKNTRKYKKENVFLDIFKTDQIKYIYIYIFFNTR